MGLKRCEACGNYRKSGRYKAKNTISLGVYTKRIPRNSLRGGAAGASSVNFIFYVVCLALLDYKSV